MSPRRAVAARSVASVVALLSLVSAGCGTSRAARETKRAFAAASYELQLPYRGQTHAEVARDLALFLDKDVALVREKALRRIASDRRYYNAAVVAGGAAAIAAGLASEWNLGGAGLAVALAGYLPYRSLVAKMEGCRLFLLTEGEALRAWGDAKLDARSNEPVGPDVWLEYVNRTHRIRSHESCLGVE